MDHKVCVVCKGPHDEEQLLLCDECDDGYHTFCLDPPLKKIPSGDWFCPSCAEKERKPKSKSKSKATTTTAKKSASHASNSKRAAKKKTKDDGDSESSEEEEEEVEDTKQKSNKKSNGKKGEKKVKAKAKAEEKEESEEAEEEEEEGEDEEEEDEEEVKPSSKGEKKAKPKAKKGKAPSKKPTKKEKVDEEEDDDDDDAMDEEEKKGEEEEVDSSEQEERNSRKKKEKKKKGAKEQPKKEESDDDGKEKKEKKKKEKKESDDGDEEEEDEESEKDEEKSATKKKRRTAGDKREAEKQQSRRASVRTRSKAHHEKEEAAAKKKEKKSPSAVSSSSSGKKKRKRSPPPPSAREKRKMERDKRKKRAREAAKSEEEEDEEEEEESEHASSQEEEEEEDDAEEEEDAEVNKKKAEKKKKKKAASKRQSTRGSRRSSRSRRSADTPEDDGDWEAQESEDEEEEDDDEVDASSSDEDASAKPRSKSSSSSSSSSSKSNGRKDASTAAKEKKDSPANGNDDMDEEEEDDDGEKGVVANGGASRKRKRQQTVATTTTATNGGGESLSKRRVGGLGTGAAAPRRLNKSLRRSERNRKRRERQERRARGEVSEDEEEEESDNEEDEMLQHLKCECCGRGDDGNKLLLCDGEGCNKGYHIFCIFPPLDEIPEDDWFCDQCELIRNNPFPTLPEGALAGTGEENVLGSPVPQGGEQLSTPTMQDWMENMSFTVKPANDRDNALDFKLRSDDMALDFAKAGTPTPGGRTSPNSLNDFDSSNFNATNSLASRTSTRIDDTKTVILWRGGLTFDGANLGDFTISFRGVPAHADECKKIVREWGDRVSLLAGKKGTSLPLVSTDSHAVTVLPGSNKAAYERFAAQLEENNWVCMISYPRSDLCIYPTAMRPAPDGSAASSRLSGLLIPKTKASVAAAVGAATAQKLAAPPGSGSPRIQEPAFMPGIRYALLGYPPANAQTPAGANTPEQRRISGVVGYLARPGGAHYVNEKDLNHANTDLIIVHPNHLHRLASLVPGMLECRLNPAIVFVRGIDYLENCCKRQALLTPHPSDVIYPSGGIIVLLADDILSGTTTLATVLALIAQEGKERREWIVKIQPEDITRLQEMKNTSPLASAALQLMQQRPEIFSAFAENETSQSKSVDIPSVVRSALKLSLVHIAKCRHVVLITENKALQGVAKGQNLLCMSMEDLKGFFADQAKLRTQPRAFKPTPEIAAPGSATAPGPGPAPPPQSGYPGPSRVPGILPLPATPVSASPLLAGLGGALNGSPQPPSVPQLHPFLGQQQLQRQPHHQPHQYHQQQQQAYSPSLASLASSAMKNGGHPGGGQAAPAQPLFGRKPP